MQNCENEFVQKINQLEELIAKKAKIYSRLLTDMALAEAMRQIVNKREEGSSVWLGLISSEQTKSNQQTKQGDENEV